MGELTCLFKAVHFLVGSACKIGDGSLFKLVIINK